MADKSKGYIGYMPVKGNVPAAMYGYDETTGKLTVLRLRHGRIEAESVAEELDFTGFKQFTVNPGSSVNISASDFGVGGIKGFLLYVEKPEESPEPTYPLRVGFYKGDPAGDYGLPLKSEESIYVECDLDRIVLSNRNTGGGESITVIVGLFY